MMTALQDAFALVSADVSAIAGLLDAPPPATQAQITSAIAVVLADIQAIVTLAATPVPPTTSLPATPAQYLTPQEAAAGITAQAFFDGFDDPSTIDMQRTYDTTKYKWFMPWNQDNSGILSVADSVLTISGQSVADDGQALCSLACKDSTSPIVGSCWNGTFSVEMKVATTNTPSLLPGNDWPAGWSIPYEWLIAQQNGATNNAQQGLSYTECDYLEIANTGGQRASMIWFFLQHWLGLGPGDGQPWRYQDTSLPDAQGVAYPLPDPGMDLSQFHLYMWIYLSPADNDGTNAKIMRFIDNTHIPNCDVTIAPGSTFSDIETQHQQLMIGGHPSRWDHVRVGVKPSSTGVLTLGG